MDVTGFVARFCEDTACTHDGSNSECSNQKTSRFYINPEEHLDILNKPLVVTHNDKYVIGRCTLQLTTAKGLLLRCEIDDVYFLESLRRRFDDFKDNYNPTIPNFETFCKKTLCSFSLSHNCVTKDVRHVSLVDTPGRLGTAVTYRSNPRVVLKRRTENQHISDIVASHSTAYTSQNDRRSYLIRNDKYSHSPSDLCYINAQRALSTTQSTIPVNMSLSPQDQFDEAAEFYRCYKMLRAQQQSEGTGCGRRNVSLKRNRQMNDDDGDDDSMGLISKRGRYPGDSDVSASATRTVAQSPSLTNDMVSEAMKDGVKQGIAAAFELMKQSGLVPSVTPTPPATRPKVAAPVTTTVTDKTEEFTTPAPVTTEIPPSPAVGGDQFQQVEASRGRAAILLSSPDNTSLECIVKNIMGI